MRTRCVPLGLSLLALAGNAGATPIPRWADLLEHRRVKSVVALEKPVSQPLYSSTQVVAIDTKLDVAPATGVVAGHVDLKVKALTGVTSVALLLDGGLVASTATAPGQSVGVSNQSVQGYAMVSLALTPGLAPGEELTFSVDYAGTLECKTQGCYAGASLAFVSENGAIPGVYDQDNLGGYNAWGASRSLEISVPAGTTVVASGDRVSITPAGAKTTTKWAIPAYHSYGGNIVMMGPLAETAVGGTSVPTSIFTASSGPSYATKWTSWMQDILPFLDAQAGQKLPYPALKVFKLPLGWLDIFRGTAGHGLTLLSEDYASGGDAYFEETLAHENAHQWWGVLVSPTDILVTRWLVEGLATFSQIDFAAQVQNASVPREEYLARRYREHWMLVKYLGDASLPLVLGSSTEVPQDSIQNTLWAYIRSSALLEYLRVVVGDAPFAQLLQSWAKDCAQKLCDSADFLALLEQVSNEDFDPVFAQWVQAGTAAAPRLAFSQSGGKLSVTAADIDGLVVPLELWITLADGALKKERVRFEGSKPVEIALTGSARSVRPNPRQDGMIWSRSAVLGDVDFDGEVDGLDVIHCAWRSGKLADPSQPGGEGIWSSDLDFDPRCDFDDSGSIGASDLAVVEQAYGNVKAGGS